ncbi:MAG: TetR/AcrR family transcriptional regulator [Sphaerochaetaceae bacterium]
MVYTDWYILNGMKSVKDQLLENALQLFARKGYDSVGVQEIADTIPVGKPTLYYYFNSKGGLLQSVFQQRFLSDYPQFKESISNSTDVFTSLTAFALTFARKAQEQPLFYLLLIQTNYCPKESDAYLVVKAYVKQMENLLVSLFEEHAPLLGNMRGRQKQFSETFLSMLYGNVYKALEQERAMDEDMVRSWVRQYAYGIYT